MRHHRAAAIAATLLLPLAAAPAAAHASHFPPSAVKLAAEPVPESGPCEDLEFSEDACGEIEHIARKFMREHGYRSPTVRSHLVDQEMPGGWTFWSRLQMKAKLHGKTVRCLLAGGGDVVDGKVRAGISWNEELAAESKPCIGPNSPVGYAA